MWPLRNARLTRRHFPPERASALELKLAGCADMVLANLFLHHFEGDSLARLLNSAARLADAFGALAIRIEHIGSTSVPGLPATSRTC